jgi:hypothetical protein
MAKEEDFFEWKIAYLPKLERWVSKSGRMAVLGDAAYAMVPHLGMVRGKVRWKTQPFHVVAWLSEGVCTTRL